MNKADLCEEVVYLFRRKITSTPSSTAWRVCIGDLELACLEGDSVNDLTLNCSSRTVRPEVAVDWLQKEANYESLVAAYIGLKLSGPDNIT